MYHNIIKILKRILDSKLFWMIVSLMISLVLWVYVTSLETDQYTRVFRGIHIELTGENILKDKGLVVSDLSTDTVSVEVSGQRRIISNLSAEDLEAQINVSTLTQSAFASMQYSIKYPDGIDSSSISVIKKSPETITFKVDKYVSKTIPVKGSFDGSTADGYSSGQVTFEPATITVSGPEEYVDDVSCAWVSFSPEGISSTYTFESAFTLMDENKNILGFENYTLSDDMVVVNLPVYKIAEIPITVDVIYGAGATEDNTTVSIEPSSIKLAGDSDVIDGLSKITLKTYDLTTFESSFDEKVTIVFDDSLTNISGVDDAYVSIKIEGLTTKKFKVSNINVINATEGYDVQVISKNIDVILRGTEENLNLIRNEHLRAVVDLKDYDYTEGAAMLVPTVFVDDVHGNSVGSISSDKVQIEIIRVG